jgi:hypothetical protein
MGLGRAHGLVCAAYFGHRRAARFAQRGAYVGRRAGAASGAACTDSVAMRGAGSPTSV